MLKPFSYILVSMKILIFKENISLAKINKENAPENPKSRMMSSRYAFNSQSFLLNASVETCQRPLNSCQMNFNKIYEAVRHAAFALRVSHPLHIGRHLVLRDYANWFETLVANWFETLATFKLQVAKRNSHFGKKKTISELFTAFKSINRTFNW